MGYEANLPSRSGTKDCDTIVRSRGRQNASDVRLLAVLPNAVQAKVAALGIPTGRGGSAAEGDNLLLGSNWGRSARPECLNRAQRGKD